MKTFKDIAVYDHSFRQTKRNYTKPALRKETLPNWASSESAIKDEPVDQKYEQTIKERLEKIRRKKDGERD